MHFYSILQFYFSRLAFYSRLCATHNTFDSKPRFLVQLIVFRYVYCYAMAHLFAIFVLAIIVDEFTIRIHQIHYDCMVHLCENKIFITYVGGRIRYEPKKLRERETVIFNRNREQSRIKHSSWACDTEVVREWSRAIKLYDFYFQTFRVLQFITFLNAPVLQAPVRSSCSDRETFRFSMNHLITPTNEEMLSPLYLSYNDSVIVYTVSIR